MPRKPLIFGAIEWGPPVGTGAFGARYGTFGGIIKPEVDPAADHRTVANEYICNRLAMMVGLPVPPGFLLRDANSSDVAFALVQGAGLTERLPPTIPSHFAADLPELAAGIVAFDEWIANKDRHDKNLAYTRGAIAPMMFDHGLALGGPTRDWTTLQDPTLPRRGGHCLAGTLSTAKDLEGWALAIRAVPLVAIQSILEEVRAADLIDDAGKTQLTAFLGLRRSCIGDLLRDFLPGLPDWGLTP